MVWAAGKDFLSFFCGGGSFVFLAGCKRCEAR